MPVIVNCTTCGNPLKRRAYNLIRSKNFFCDLECRGKYHSQNLLGQDNPTYRRVPASCAGCGSELLVIPYRAKSHKKHFCNKACYGVWMSRNKVGDNHPLWKGGYKEYYGPNWNTQRRSARQRDNCRCQHCKITERKLGKELDVHHVVPFRTFGYIQGENERYKDANRIENLISLCASCHQYAERGNLSVQLRMF